MNLIVSSAKPCRRSRLSIICSALAAIFVATIIVAVVLSVLTSARMTTSKSINIFSSHRKIKLAVVRFAIDGFDREINYCDLFLVIMQLQIIFTSKKTKA